jgi:hypothetical protein
LLEKKQSSYHKQKCLACLTCSSLRRFGVQLLLVYQAATT